MGGESVFFRDLAYIFVAALVGGGLAWIARQPLILGYVVGGLLINPLTPGPSVAEVHPFETFAEIGVVLLMFSLGIEFSLRDLLRVRRVAVLGGTLGMSGSIGLGFAATLLLGLPPVQALVVGFAVSIASSMVLVRMLMDRGEQSSRHGRIAVGISLMEDLAAVILLVLVPALGALEPGRLLAIARALGTGAAILVPFFWLAAKVLPPVMTRVARTHDQELFLLVALAFGFGTAAVTRSAGLSLALGAFLGGLIISESDYAHETLARVLPLRDAFVALFFVTIGAVIDPAAVLGNLPLLGTMMGLIVAGNFMVWTAVVWLFGSPLGTAVRVAVSFTQIGEFSFLVVQVARDAGHVGPEVYNTTLAAALLTILLNAALVRWIPDLIRLLRLGHPAERPDERETAGRYVVLCGFGRVGSAVAEALATFAVRYVAIDIDPDVVQSLRRRGIPSLFGDASHRRLLVAAGAARAALVVLALPDTGRAHLAVRHVRAINPDAPILARAHEPGAHERLRAAGATEVIEPEMEAAATLIRHALRRLALPSERVREYLGRLREAVDETFPPAPAGPGLPEVREVVVEGGSLAGEALRESRVRERFGVSVLTVIRVDGTTVHHPGPDTVMGAGDRLRVFGLADQIASFAAAIAPPGR
jgi:CPA2 family monovalent cation:H+ antiporter-2